MALLPVGVVVLTHVSYGYSHKEMALLPMEVVALAHVSYGYSHIVLSSSTKNQDTWKERDLLSCMHLRRICLAQATRRVIRPDMYTQRGAVLHHSAAQVTNYGMLYLLHFLIVYHLYSGTKSKTIGLDGSKPPEP